MITTTIELKEKGGREGGKEGWTNGGTEEGAERRADAQESEDVDSPSHSWGRWQSL